MDEGGAAERGADEGGDEADVGEVGAAEVGVVEDEDIALGGVGELVDDGLGGERHGADEDGEAGLALDEGVTGGAVVEAMAGVVGFGDGGVEGGAEEGGVHFVGDLFEPAFEDRQGDAVHSCSRASLIVA